MKVSNLFFFFYASSGVAPKPPVVEEEDSGYFIRRIGRAFPEALTLSPELHRVTVTASATIAVPPLSSLTPVFVSPSIAAEGFAVVFEGFSLSPVVRPSTAAGESSVAVGPGLSVRSSLRGTAVGAATVSVRGFSTLLRIGRVEVEIGPDLIAQEFEELLLLMEV